MAELLKRFCSIFNAKRSCVLTLGAASVIRFTICHASWIYNVLVVGTQLMIWLMAMLEQTDASDSEPVTKNSGRCFSGLCGLERNTF